MSNQESTRVIVINESINISDNVEVSLTEEEKNTLNLILDWLKSNIANLELDTFEIGFPSGIKAKFKKKKN